jgi:hypothetical protein
MTCNPESLHKGHYGYRNPKRASSNVGQGLDICRATKGAHIEIYGESYILRKKL